MNVSLTPELQKYVTQQVKSGLYQTASEVVRDALRKLKGIPERRQPELPKTLDELEDLLEERIAAMDRGEGIDGKTMFRELRKDIEKAKRARRRG
jgi:antitoxin ParD1/3/4